MPLYTFDSPRTPARLFETNLIADTSYLISYSDASHHFYPSVSTFHISSIANSATFFINVIVRQEFIKMVRKQALVVAMTALARADPSIEARYKSVLGISRPLRPSDFTNSYVELYKEHTRLDDTAALLAALRFDIWREVYPLETIADMTYFHA